jgi:hypothetical protein
MPVKKRLPKARAELTRAQQAFLWDEDLLIEDVGFGDWIQHCWLTSACRDRTLRNPRTSEEMPDGSPTPRKLWAAYGEEVLADWVEAHPGTRPAPWWRFSALAPRPKNESEAVYLDRHGLLLPAERRRLTEAHFEPVAEPPVRGRPANARERR